MTRGLGLPKSQRRLARTVARKWVNQTKRHQGCEGRRAVFLCFRAIENLMSLCGGDLDRALTLLHLDVGTQQARELAGRQ